MAWYLVKIVETHIEIIKDGVLFVVNFHLAILDSAERKNGRKFFSESSCIKSIRLKVKLLLTDISQGKYTVSCTIKF